MEQLENEWALKSEKKSALPWEQPTAWKSEGMSEATSEGSLASMSE